MLFSATLAMLLVVTSIVIVKAIFLEAFTLVLNMPGCRDFSYYFLFGKGYMCWFGLGVFHILLLWLSVMHTSPFILKKPYPLSTTKLCSHKQKGKWSNKLSGSMHRYNSCSSLQKESSLLKDSTPNSINHPRKKDTRQRVHHS